MTSFGLLITCLVGCHKGEVKKDVKEKTPVSVRTAKAEKRVLRPKFEVIGTAVGGMALSVGGMLVAAAGHLPPVAGAIAQEVIDVLAVLNALRASLTPRVLTDYGPTPDARHSPAPAGDAA